jgi:histidinol-phosphate/aromatic aminotransferase/cobyric acid decarboxylase-like protein
MIRVISRRRGVPAESVLAGGGSSDLIYLALREWLLPRSRVLLLSPTYGEYDHVLEHVIGCFVERLDLSRKGGYQLDPKVLAAALEQRFDLSVIVNPNSPTGHHLPRNMLQPVLEAAPASTRFWIDETYVEYAGPDQSLERFAAQSDNAMVCKSMSKVYALSGARAAYLCGPPEWIGALKRISPPWAVGLVAQVAAVEALNDPEYYAARYAETAILRDRLAEDLAGIGLEIVPGTANFLLCHLPNQGPTASQVRDVCRSRGLFVRVIEGRGQDPPALRIAVKDTETNQRMVSILSSVIKCEGDFGARR